METKELIKKHYHVSGMTCGGCVATVKEALESTEGVLTAQVQLADPQVTVETESELDLQAINEKLKGKYTVSAHKAPQQLAPLPTIGQPKTKSPEMDLPGISIRTYKPLLLIVGFIAGVSLLVQYPFTNLSGFLWMQHFMAGFFLVFSFFKLLNLEGFASSYRMYDIVAARWNGWSYVYPFVELALGISYLIHFAPFYTNLATVIILGVSSIGVIESNLNKRKIKCACLGDVFNLPMSTVTIVEDLTMVAMAAWMLWM